MADGTTKPIERIQPGDHVMSRDELTGKAEAKELVRVFEHHADQLVVIRLSNGEEIETTPEHPFWVEDKGWTFAGNLKSLDRLTTTSSTSSIFFVEWKRTPSKVYNFEVEDYHTYFVSVKGTDVWVHNTCTPPNPAARSGAGSNLPVANGPKNGSLAHDTGRGRGVIRDYDEHGHAKVEYDFGHDHTGAGDPHAHDWIWSAPKPVRGKPRPLLPGE